ncbi:Uncharacterized protein M6B38_221200 [Iris pallida]|nr:Uncharacterized protein M6B38_221200 [Iris pallida]
MAQRRLEWKKMMAVRRLWILPEMKRQENRRSRWQKHLPRREKLMVLILLLLSRSRAARSVMMILEVIGMGKVETV